MKSPFLTVYGHVSIDQIITLREFPQMNTSVDIIDKRRYLGGTGANIATMAARLGVPTSICSYVGDDFPTQFWDTMAESELIMDELIAVKGEETSTAMIVSDGSNDQITYFYQGPLGQADPDETMTAMAKQSRHVHFSTGNPDYHLRVMEALEGLELSTSLDPAQEVHRIWDADRFNEALIHSDILFSNEHEMSSMLRYAGRDGPEDLPVDTIILTRGKEGADVWHDGEYVHILPIAGLEAVDTTGAGDSFRAGFYAGLYNGYDMVNAAMLGSAAASFTIASVGALSASLKWEEVLQRAEETYEI